jgi:hypothetical protein
MKLVTFSRHWGGNSGYYNSGETAGFDDVTADVLIKSGVAVLAETQPEADAADDPPPPVSRKELDAMIPALTKAELVKLGTEHFGLTLDVRKTKDDLAAALQAAADAADVKAAEAAKAATAEANG